MKLHKPGFTDFLVQTEVTGSAGRGPQKKKRMTFSDDNAAHKNIYRTPPRYRDNSFKKKVTSLSIRTSWGWYCYYPVFIGNLRLLRG